MTPWFRAGAKHKHSGGPIHDSGDAYQGAFRLVPVQSDGLDLDRLRLNGSILMIDDSLVIGHRVSAESLLALIDSSFHTFLGASSFTTIEDRCRLAMASGNLHLYMADVVEEKCALVRNLYSVIPQLPSTESCLSRVHGSFVYADVGKQAVYKMCG